MSTKHTFGPWQYKRTSGFDYGSTAYWIPEVCTNIDTEANARIIAAAPDLLEALQRIKETGAFVGAIAQEMMDAAIAKATGEKQ
jgi:hypothetical protein